MKQRFWLTTLTTLILLQSAHAGDPATANFVRQASLINAFELQSNKLGITQLKDEKNRAFARKLVDDHAQIGKVFDQALQTSSMQQEYADPALDEAYELLLAKMFVSKPYDKAYIAIQIQQHGEAIKLFSNYAAYGKDAKLKEFSKQVLPIYQAHLETLKTLRVPPQ